MPLRLAYVMDPLSGILLDKDTTFAWLLEAQGRGHANFYIGRGLLALHGTEPRALAAPLEVQRVPGDHFRLGEARWTPLAEFDVIFMRQDPPIDLEYLYATHILSHVKPPSRVLNNPHALREANEKLYGLQFPELIPPTLVSSHMESIRHFLHEQAGRAVIKPLDRSGGAGVFILDPHDPNLTALLEISTNFGQRSVVVQRYLPQAKDGDKRVILIGGAPVGAVLRVPTGQGEHRGNIHVGGQCMKTTLTAREQEACQHIGPRLLADGLHFVGLDFIGGFLTEVNVTSPTGVQEIDALDGVNLEAAWLDYVERLVTTSPPCQGD